MLRRLVEAIQCTRSRAVARGSTASAQPAAMQEHGILDNATDWKVTADLPDMRSYPDVIKRHNVRPDVVLVSELSKTAW